MKHILMIDDVATNLKCAAEVLRDSYKISTAKSGIRALELLKEIVPDLILLDINMPEMDGFTVFEWLKSKPELSQIPVIFLTAEKDKKKEEKGLQMGAADYIYKPYEPDELLERIARVLLLQEEKQGMVWEADFPALREETLEEVVLEQSAGHFILLSMNQFEQIQDILGRDAGEELVKRTRKVIQEEVGEQGSFCFLKKSKFAVFLNGSYEKEQMKTIVRRLIAGIEFEVNETLPEEFGYKVSVVAGIARKPEEGIGYAELYECADKALYFVKQSGKQSYYFYCTELNEQREAAEEKEPIYILQIKRLFSEKVSKGAETALFEKACNLLVRYLGSHKQSAQAIWIQAIEEGKQERPVNVSEMMKEVIEGSLRKGDLALPCKEHYYMVILMNASRENSNRVSERISRKWQELLPDSGIKLVFEVKSI